MRRWLLIALVGPAALLAGCGGGARTPASGPLLPATTPTGWCLAQGGRPATYTSAAGSSARIELCRFTAADGSRIVVGVDTLAAERPTAAAIAYVHRPAVPGFDGRTNPAVMYCTHLGGTTAGGATAAWSAGVGTGEPVDLCGFPDGSVIDQWGLLYHARGTIHGADLTNRFRATIPPPSAGPSPRRSPVAPRSVRPSPTPASPAVPAPTTPMDTPPGTGQPNTGPPPPPPTGGSG